MRSAVLKISGALDFTALLSRNQLPQSRPFNLFQGVNNFQERSLSQFHQRELFNSDNKRADNNGKLNSERSVEDAGDNEKFYQAERAVFDNNKDSINKQVFGEKGQMIDRTLGSDQIESQSGNREEYSVKRRAAQFPQIHDSAATRAKYAHVFYQTSPNK